MEAICTVLSAQACGLFGNLSFLAVHFIHGPGVFADRRSLGLPYMEYAAVPSLPLRVMLGDTKWTGPGLWETRITDEDCFVFTPKEKAGLWCREASCPTRPQVPVMEMGERPNERVIMVGIGWVLLASATSGFSGNIKLAYCSSAKGLQ